MTETTIERAAVGSLVGGFKGPGTGVRERVRIDGRAGTPLEGFWIEVDGGLTNGEIEALKRNTYWVDLYALMAPHVLAWNYVAELVEPVDEPAVLDEAGTEVVKARTVHKVTAEEWLLPPAAVGSDVFIRVDEVTRRWIVNRLRGLPEEVDEATLKALTRLVGSPSGAHDGTAPPATAAPSPSPNRRAPATS